MAWSDRSSGGHALVQSTSGESVRRPGSHRTVILPLIAIVAAVAGFLVFDTGQSDQDLGASFDDDLCPSDGQRISGSATYLLDLRKPLADAAAPGRVLADVGRDLAEGVELKVFAISDQATTPRRLLARLCKPYSEAEIAVSAAKDHSQGQRDCQDLPAQVSKRTRDLATRFCARRDALRARIDALAAEAPGTVANAYLLEAIQDTATALADRPAPRILYVFSDMLQHAEWYSHLDLRWTEWGFAAFQSKQAEAQPLRAGPALTPASAPWRVEVFYPPRARVTEPLRPRYAHQTFWRRYFETQGAEVSFRELPRAPAYYAPQLMVTQADAIAQDIEAMLQDTERRRKAAAELELALTEFEGGDAPAQEADAPPTPAAGPAPQTEQLEPPPPLPRVVRGSDAERPGASVVEPPPATTLALADLPPLPAAPEPAGAPPSAACVIALKPEFTAALAPGGYPSEQRVSYGAGVVTVRYTVDAQGRTIDADVVARAEPAAGRQSNSAALTEDTAAEVRGWEFAFADANPTDCALTPRIATFNYVERCVGSPVPTCRTVRANVTF